MPEKQPNESSFNAPQQQSNGTNDKNNNQNAGVFADQVKSQSIQLEVPQITLPKGGGALKGIDEKFQVNAANGTAGFSIPLPISKTRSDISPALSLSYNSGGGNGCYGLGSSAEASDIEPEFIKHMNEIGIKIVSQRYCYCKRVPATDTGSLYLLKEQKRRATRA